MKKIPKKAMLDGDILKYHTAFWAEANNPDHFPVKLDSLVEKWTPDGVSKIVIALSCNRSDNFRKKEWPNYKSNRIDSYVPEYLHDVYDFMIENYKCKLLPNLEADDILGIYASKNTHIAVTVDKDLLGVPGWHLNPNKDKDLRYITNKEAHRFFCKQWIMGDSVDNIPGLWRVGPKKADKMLEEWDEKDWEANIIKLYTDFKYRIRENCGLTDAEVAIAMARCVKILTNKEYNLRTKKIKLWNPIVGS